MGRALGVLLAALSIVALLQPRNGYGGLGPLVIAVVVGGPMALVLSVITVRVLLQGRGLLTAAMLWLPVMLGASVLPMYASIATN